MGQVKQIMPQTSVSLIIPVFSRGVEGLYVNIGAPPTAACLVTEKSLSRKTASRKRQMTNLPSHNNEHRFIGRTSEIVQQTQRHLARTRGPY